MRVQHPFVCQVDLQGWQLLGSILNFKPWTHLAWVVDHVHAATHCEVERQGQQLYLKPILDPLWTADHACSTTFWARWTCKSSSCTWHQPQTWHPPCLNCGSWACSATLWARWTCRGSSCTWPQPSTLTLNSPCPNYAWFTSVCVQHHFVSKVDLEGQQLHLVFTIHPNY